MFGCLFGIIKMLFLFVVAVVMFLIFPWIGLIVLVASIFVWLFKSIFRL